MAAPDQTTPPPNATPPGDGWQRDSQDREYVAARGRSGIIFRQGEETLEQAFERDAKGPKDQKPKRKSSQKRKPPAPTQKTLKDMEHALAEALQMPAMPCAMFGDEWAAQHFTMQGPVLARNLVAAAEHNPWLRIKLEAMLAGGDMGVKLIGILMVVQAVVGYSVPPIVWWFNLPVPDQARQMLGIPERETEEPDAPAPAPQTHPQSAVSA